MNRDQLDAGVLRARRASSGALIERSSQPSRILSVTGTVTAFTVASIKRQRVIEVAHQRRAGLAAGHMARRAAHVDIDDVGACGFGDPGAFCHPMRLRNRRAEPRGGRCRRRRAHVDIARGPLRRGLGSPSSRIRPALRPSRAARRRNGASRDARHRRQKDVVGQCDIANRHLHAARNSLRQSHLAFHAHEIGGEFLCI